MSCCPRFQFSPRLGPSSVHSPVWATRRFDSVLRWRSAICRRRRRRWCRSAARNCSSFALLCSPVEPPPTSALPPYLDAFWQRATEVPARRRYTELILSMTERLERFVVFPGGLLGPSTQHPVSDTRAACRKRCDITKGGAIDDRCCGCCSCRCCCCGPLCTDLS